MIGVWLIHLPLLSELVNFVFSLSTHQVYLLEAGITVFPQSPARLSAETSTDTKLCQFPAVYFECSVM
jgi:hypothetical protein